MNMALVLYDITMFQYEQTKNAHFMKWGQQVVSKKEFKVILTWIINRRDYSPDSPEQDAEFESFKNKQKIQASVRQIKSIAHSAMLNQRKLRYRDLRKIAPRIALEYNGKNILDLSKRHDVPPLTALHQAMMVTYYRDHPTLLKLSRLFSGHSSENPLTGANKSQYEIAKLHDAGNAETQRKSAEIARENEMRFVAFFRDTLKIKIMSEAELIDKQVREYGRAISTPDLIFLEPTIINGTPVVWIDYKDYIGAPIQLLAESNAKQAAKYNDHWGPGAICYRDSFIEGFSIDNTLLLDASQLGIEFVD